jgi:hypothetical protein
VIGISGPVRVAASYQCRCHQAFSTTQDLCTKKSTLA